jgi:Fe-S-cluster containining protein
MTPTMKPKIKIINPEELEKIRLLGTDDKVPFECKKCGKCCKGRNDLMLTPYDTFRLARHLSRTTTAVIKRYCEIYECPDSHIPVARIIPRPPDNRCPFWRKEKCFVNKVKPTFCRTFPLAKVNMPSGEKSSYYLYGYHDCIGEKWVTVRDWVGDAASDESERAWTEWSNALARIEPLLSGKLDALTPEERANCIENIFLFMYLPYGTNQEFAPQLKYNADFLCSILEKDFGILKRRIGDSSQRTEGKS